jgi:type VII secretion protein EccB
MQSDRDHLEAYHFSVARLASALTAGTPGTGEAPLRRASLGLAIGTALAVLICGVTVLYSVLNPAASTAWRQNGSIVVNQQTGTRYLYLRGVLHPTANYASAALISGASAAISYVPATVLAGVPVGPMVGIPGAPDNLPSASALLPGRWAVCVSPGNRGQVTLKLGAVTGSGPAVSAERIVVAGPTGTRYLIWQNVKYPLTGTSTMVALGLGTTVPVAVPQVWLDALSSGPALAPAAVPEAGRPGERIAGRPARVGELFVSQAAGVGQYYVLLTDGLAPISRTEFALFSAEPGAASPVAIGPAAVAAARASANRSLLTSLPDLVDGQLYRPQGEALCVRQSSSSQPAGDTLVSTPAPASGAGAVVPPGTGMIVLQANSPATPYLITDTGMKYALIGSKAVTALGYQGARVHVLPAQVLALVPAGPALEVTAARQAIAWPR